MLRVMVGYEVIAAGLNSVRCNRGKREDGKRVPGDISGGTVSCAIVYPTILTKSPNLLSGGSQYPEIGEKRGTGI